MTDQEPTGGYADKTVAELQDLAREREIAGRSSMNREELVAALTVDDAAPPVPPNATGGDGAVAGTPPAGASARVGGYRPATKTTPITANAKGEPR